MAATARRIRDRADTGGATGGFSFEGQPKAKLNFEFWHDTSAYDPHVGLDAWQKRRAVGKSLRAETPREAHAAWAPEPDRPNVLDIVLATNAGRQQELIPLRMARMAASPFTFYRGAAAVMAWDLARTASSGIPVVMDGDAHLNNFGLYATPQREIIFDLNDFDEAVAGPWEWDLKRLVASINIAGRENGLSAKERRRAVVECARGYRMNAARLQSFGCLETWYLHAYPERILASAQKSVSVKIDPKTKAIWTKAIEKARRTTNETLLPKVAHPDAEGAWRFNPAPPVLTRVDDETAEKVIHALAEYGETMVRERRFMLKQYRVADVAHRVVGVGSVGVRAYLALLFGNGNSDPLFLQIKEATPPAHGPYLPPLQMTEQHEGRRVVLGQRLLQASTDFMLGWTKIDGRDFYVRQMKNMKGSIPVEWLSGQPFDFYAFACGAILARGHARTGDVAKIAGYCGSSATLDNALAEFAEAYADQNARDHKALVTAIADGRVAASSEA